MVKGTGRASQLSLLLLLSVRLSLAQFAGCPMISDLDTLSQLVLDALSPEDDALLQPFSVMILRNYTVCVSVGPEDGTFSSVSMLVQYQCKPLYHPVCAAAVNSSSQLFADASDIVQQFDFGCKFVADGYHWSPEQFGRDTGSHLPTADFDTPLRTDCSACIENGVAERLGLHQLLHMDPVTRCLACSHGCADAGMGRCFGVADTMCCNYFANGSCVNLCPHTTQPGSNYNCQRVVVGFEEKVYMVEEGQARLELPVVVKEGLLTQRVTLLITIADKTTTVGEDYLLFNDRIHLVPNPRADRSDKPVVIEIRDDGILEDNEEFVVNLELKEGSSAALDVSSTVVLIMEDLMEESEEPSTNATTSFSPPPTLPIENGCEEEFDNVWGLHWPTAAQRTITSVSCGSDNRGIATRKCLEGAVWGKANVSRCENQVISAIGKMAEELFSQPDVQVTQALDVLRELADASSDLVATNVSQLPRDLETASNIVAKTVDLLLVSAAGNDTVNGTLLKEVYVNETVVVVEVLSLLLTEQNKNGFTSLHVEGSTNDSRTILNSAEKYIFYVGQVMVEDSSNNPGHLTYSQDNLVLVSERRNRENPELGSEVSDVTLPRRHKLQNTVTEPKPPAVITIPGTLLREQYKGNVSVTSLFFQDLHNLLPTNSSNGTAPRSFVISSEIYGQPADTSTPLVFEDTPITLTFTLELNADEVPKCAFWDFSKGIEKSGWSLEGLKTESVMREGNNVTLTCSSTHLTSFAVLVDVGGAKITHKPLQIISYIGISVSIACLFLTILFFASLGKKLFSTVHNFIHLNLSVSLFVAYIIFAVGIEVATSNQSACRAVAALIQYFLLSAFCWMMCEGVMLYLMLVVVFSRVTEKWWFFLLLGWGLPLIFVVIGLSSVLDEYGVRDSNGQLLYCWLASGDGKHAIWTFVAPMLGIVAVNSVFLVLVLRSIYISRSSQDSRNKKGQKRHSLAKYIVKASLILLPLLGLTWVFGLFAVNDNTVVFAWLFTIFNSLQGVSIFAFHVLRNDRVWGRFRKSMKDPDGFLRSFSTRMTTRSGTWMSSMRFSRQSEVEMKSHSGPVSATSGLASYPSKVPAEDLFEPREDTPSSGSTSEPTVDPTTEQQNNSNGIHTETNISDDTTNGCPQNGTTTNGSVPHDNNLPNAEEGNHKDSCQESEFSYIQLCDDIAIAINGASRKLSNST